MFFRLLRLCSVKMAYRALEVEGRVLSCQAKPRDGYKKKFAMVLYIITFFVCACKFLE